MSCSTTEDDKWKDDVRSQLVHFYGEESSTPDLEGLMRLFFFLDSQDSQSTPGTISPFWRTLRTAMKLDANTVLKHYADRMIKDVTECEKDPLFRACMARIYEDMMSANDVQFEENQIDAMEKLIRTPLQHHTGATVGFITALARTWDVMTPVTQAAFVKTVKSLATNYRALSCVDEAVSLINKTGGSVVMVALAAVSLSWQVIANMRRWWGGEISGKRCAKNCVDSLLEIGAGFGGGLAGASVGSMIFPVVGTIIGGIAGGLIAGSVAKILADRLTMFIFDLPKEEATENAYSYLGVHHSASNDVINRAFRAKALKYHPDKGGKAEDFHELQFRMAVVKMARGEPV